MTASPSTRTLLAALLALPGLAAADITYQSTVLTRPGLAATVGRSLNDAGVVAGNARANDQTESAFIASGGTLSLFAIGNQATFASAINNAGVWAGNTIDGNSGQLRPFVRAAGTTTFLSDLNNDGALALAINASGQVAGHRVTANNGTSAVWWNGGSMLFLPGVGGSSITAAGINDAGQIVGSANNALGNRRATLWQNGLATDLGTLGGDRSAARAINNHGSVVGSANSSNNGPSSAFIWQGGSMRSLGQLDDESDATGINDFNLVVGTSANAFGNTRAFVAGAQGMHDLNGLLAVAPVGNQRLTQATDVNRHGQILAQNQAGFAVLLTPQGTLRWQASGDGSFTDGGAWDSGVGQGPSRFLDLVLSHPASQTVEMSESAEARSLVLGAGGGAGAGQMRLRLSAGAVLTAEQGIVIERSGTLTGDGVLLGDVQLAGTLQLGCGFNACSTGSRLYQDSRYTFDVRSGGLVTGTGLLEATLTVQAGGELRAEAGQRLRVSAPGQVHVSNGVLEARNGGEFRIDGRWQNRTGTVRIDGGTARFDGGLENLGQVQIAFGGADVYGRVNNLGGGRIIASGGSQATFWDALTNNGEVRASAGSQIVYFGPVDGAGSFTTNGAGAYHRFEGGFAPGNSPADVVLGETQLASTLTMELGGTTPGTQHDRITFTGLLTLDAGAQLEVVLIDGFVPQEGQVFDLFAFQAGVAGTFDSLRLPMLTNGWVWDTTALHTAGDLRVSAAVPEPGTWLSLAGGLLLLVARRRWGATAAAAVQASQHP